MLTIKIEEPPLKARGAQSHLALVAKPEWFEDPIVKQMIKDIDKSEVISYLSMKNPIFGVHSFRELSGGVQLLILLYKDVTDYPLWLTKCGDNCTPWICKLSKSVDKTVYLSHLMHFYDECDCSCIRVEGVNKVPNSAKELNSQILYKYIENEEKGLIY